MNSRNFLKLIVPFVSAGLLASCSNDSQPLSVESGFGQFKTAVTNANLHVKDMGYTEGNLWAVTTNTVPSSPNNYYLAKFNFTTNEWVVSTTHWGVACAASADGKCWHVNSQGQIWWVTSINGTGTQIDNPPGGLAVSDIGVTDNWLWVSPKGKKYLYQGMYSGSGRSMTWTQTSSWTGGTATRVSIGPFNGQPITCTSTGQIFYHFDPEVVQITFPWLAKDVANCDNLLAAISNNSILYLTDPNGSNYEFISTGLGAKSSVAMTQIQGINAVLYIGLDNHLCVAAFSDLLP